MNKVNFKKYIGTPMIFYCILMVFSLLMGAYHPGYNGIRPSNAIYILVGSFILWYLYQKQLGTSPFKKSFLTHGIVAIIIFLVVPILYKLSFGELRTKTTTLYYAYSTSLFFFLTIGQLYLTRKLKLPKIVAGIFSLIDVIALAFPASLILYFVKFKSLPTMPTFMALYNTTTSEARGFIEQQLSTVAIVLIIIAIVGTYIICYLGNKDMYNKMKDYQGYKITWPFVISFMIITSLIFPFTYLPRGIKDIYKYQNLLGSYGKTHDELMKKVKFDKPSSMINEVPGTIIVVVGESANRDYMKAFTPSYQYDTTPWESYERTHNKNFVFFDKAYSSYVQTEVSLSRALTERSQYTEKDFINSVNFVELANKLGYNTYWFSNQGMVSRHDTMNTMIAKSAKKTQWISMITGKDENYDMMLLPELKKVPKGQNNLIVLHIMGSHGKYKDRYPKSAEIFKASAKMDQETVDYENSIYYTDEFLKDVYDYASKNLNLQAMVYFSDHGEEIHVGHNPDYFSFEQTRIPMWVYLSPKYQQAYPKIMQTLRANADKYWTNDMFYDLFVGLLQAPNKTYHPNQDISNKKYNFTPQTLMTMLGKYNISDDPKLKNIVK